MKVIQYLFLFLNLLLFIMRCESPSDISENESLHAPELYKIDTLVHWTQEFNPYILKKDVEIFNNGELIIDPGVKLYLYEKVLVNDPAGNWFRVPIIDVKDGQLICNGTKSDPITMQDSSGINTVGFINFNSNSDLKSQSILNGIKAEYVMYWDNRDVFINNSEIREVNIFNKNYVEITSNKFDNLHYGAGEVDAKYKHGIIKNNKFEKGVFLLSDSLLFTENILENQYSSLLCSHNSKTRIIGNFFYNCNVAISIFFSTPSIHQNNIFNNETNIKIIPDWNNPQHDTIYANNNWWGTVDTIEIVKKIIYKQNGDSISGKHFEYIPFATKPFDY